MNCFEWRNRSSDYIDGMMNATAKRESEEHLESCEDCRATNEHYRTLIQAISQQPRTSLPVPLRKAPLSSPLPRPGGLSRKSRWESTPWLIKTGVEGLGLAALVLLVVVAAPRLRTLYEKSMEKRIENVDPSELGAEYDLNKMASSTVPLTRGKLAPTVGATDPNAHEDFNSESNESADDAEASGSILEDGDIRVGSSEIWRFNLRTESPREFRAKIVQSLMDLKIPSNTAGLGGVEAPGGIQFDLIISQGQVPALKRTLQKLASQSNAARAQAVSSTSDSATSGGTGRTVGTEPFTWYKNKSKRPIPSGKARVVIWLSQI